MNPDLPAAGLFDVPEMPEMPEVKVEDGKAAMIIIQMILVTLMHY